MFFHLCKVHQLIPHGRSDCSRETWGGGVGRVGGDAAKVKEGGGRRGGEVREDEEEEVEEEEGEEG